MILLGNRIIPIAMPMIERINHYKDPRFAWEVLAQHGAYLIDGKPCSFKILSPDTALIETEVLGSLDEVIDEFRFYSEHITRFVDEEANLIKAFAPIQCFEVMIDALQPSQFYISQEKLDAIATWLNHSEDIIVPLNYPDIICDGHTRLYLALHQGIKKAYAFYTDSNDSITDFVQEAKKRGIDSVSDMEILEAKAYEEKWHAYCDQYFAKNR